MPNIPGLTEDTDQQIATDQLPQLEEAIMMWQAHIDGTITACMRKVQSCQYHFTHITYYKQCLIMFQKIV